MRYIVSAASFLLITALDFPLPAQYPGGSRGGYPGGGYPYPGGGYPTGPGIPIPRRSKDKKTEEKSKQPQLQSLTGVLRRIDDSSVTIVAKDTRTITAKRSDDMKVLRKGETRPIASLTPGDHVRIDATQDDHGFYHAVAIYVESEATPEEKKAAAESATEAPAEKSAEDEDRPVLRRSPNPADQGSDSEKADSAPERERTSATVTAAPDTADELDPDRPRIRRGKPPARKTRGLWKRPQRSLRRDLRAQLLPPFRPRVSQSPRITRGSKRMEPKELPLVKKMRESPKRVRWLLPTLSRCRIISARSMSRG